MESERNEVLGANIGKVRKNEGSWLKGSRQDKMSTVYQGKGQEIIHDCIRDERLKTHHYFKVR
jgi:hypothetical protein